MLFFENTLEFATPLFGDLRILLRVALPLFIVRKKMRKIVMVVFVFNLRLYTNCGTYNVQLINRILAKLFMFLTSFARTQSINVIKISDCFNL